MRFSAIHKATSYLMVLAAFATLALSHELSPPVVIGTFVIALGSYFFEPARHAVLRARGWSTTWNALTLAVFAWTLLEAIRGELLSSGVRFLCFLLVNKLWNRKSSRDYLQAYVVSFLMLVAGAALNNDLAYAGCFLAYVVFATWTLTLFHLRREMEENYLIKHSDDGAERVEVERILNSRRIVGWSFLGATSLVSIGVFICAALTFFLIPRFGFGFFATHSRRGGLTVGFSDRVDLDAYGRVKDNPQVIMRIEFPTGTPPEQPLHLRGVAFDRYEHGRWSRTISDNAQLRSWSGYTFVGHAAIERLSGARVRALLDHAVEQRIYLDPLDTSVLFGAATAIAYQMPQNAVGGPAPVALVTHGSDEPYAMERRYSRNFTTDLVERKNGLRYTVFSDLSGPDPRTLAAAEDVDIDEELAPYIAVPHDLPPRIAELARSITAKKSGPWQKAEAIRDYLQRYKYTLDLKRDERYEPLEDFLFVQRAGHCEYFASAMAVMLRTVGVPTRSVNGFYGGEWNSFGHYLAVRQGDAHSWVEIYIGGHWVTVDPTPPGAAVPVGGAWTTLRQMLDNIELAWFKYVIEYDLGKQVEIARSVGRWAQFASKRDALDRLVRRHAVQVGGGVALIFGAWMLLAAWRRRRVPQVRLRRGAEALSAFHRAVRALERRGFTRTPGETGRELATRVRAASDPGADSFGQLVDLYYAARFGAIPVAAGDLERLAQEVIRAPKLEQHRARAA
ncbi:MAG: transglutaminase domain protein [Myxococcales bacterium]|nr:transglutaminase domain protein [Myxococcales bacterium]